MVIFRKRIFCSKLPWDPVSELKPVDLGGPRLEDVFLIHDPKKSLPDLPPIS